MIRLAILFVAVSLSAAYPGRIIGGKNTTIAEHPYQVSIQYFEKQICGGVIVAANYVMTAAQCIPPKGTNPNFVNMRVGGTDRVKEGFLYEAEDWTKHPNFKTETMDCDIGFFKTQYRFSFRLTIKAIKLIDPEEYPKHGEMLTISGWGRNTLINDGMPNILQQARIPKLGWKYCEDALEKLTFKFTKNMFCAGGGILKLISVGDFGGPIVNQNQKLVGIASGTAARYGLGFPSVFTDISSKSIRNYISRILNGTLWQPDS